MPDLSANRLTPLACDDVRWKERRTLYRETRVRTLCCIVAPWASPCAPRLSNSFNYVVSRVQIAFRTLVSSWQNVSQRFRIPRK